jgi:hypothetical protein
MATVRIAPATLRNFFNCLSLDRFLLMKTHGESARKPALVQNWRPSILQLLFALYWTMCVSAVAERCSICGEEFTGDTVYLITDKMTQEKVRTCITCVRSAERCTMCGRPVPKDFIKLADGRFLCSRDSKSAVTNPDEALRICHETRDQLEKLFSRFISFPNNIQVTVVDRINLLTLFKIPGNDYECPNILGYFRATTNLNQRRYDIHVMSGMRLPELKETYAHEQTHAWVFENVSPERKQTLSRDAEEGFCELVGYLLMDSQKDEEMKRALLRNDYTHGQINLFVDAERRFGFNEIVDWIKFGVDSQLVANNLERVRTIEMPRPERAVERWTLTQVPAGPDKITLKGISWTQARALALINNQSFAPGESGKVLVGTTKVGIRCLNVRENSVRIKILESGEELELLLPGATK